MQHPFAALAPEYASLLGAMRLDPCREHDLASRAAQVLDLAHRHRDEWAEVEAKTSVPRLWGMASFERESGSDYSRSPAQGDRWDRVSVHVPVGLGPYRCWGDACVEAYRLDRLGEVAGGDATGTPSPLVGEGWGGGASEGTSAVPRPTPTSDPSPAETAFTRVSATELSDRNRQQPISIGGGETQAAPSSVIQPPSPVWTWPRACYEGELFNGFGPRAHGRHTGYLWSWTNIYAGGKYVADGKWDPDVKDQQCGMVPMMAALLRLDSTLALANAPPWTESADVSPAPSPPSPASGGGGAGGPPALPGPPAMPAEFGTEQTLWLQAALNRLGAAERLSKHERLSKPEGCAKYPPLIVDGCYGRHTRRAVAAFQAARGLVPDGLAGPVTLAALRESAP